MSHQDWTPVTLRKSTQPTGAEAMRQGIIMPEKKAMGGKNKQTKFDSNMRKLDDTVVPQLATITHELAQQIQQARAEKKWTQEELAKRSNVPVATLKNYENQNSRVVVQSDILTKLGRALGITLKKPVIKQTKEDD
jgi:ribosome-binding protein aMBF1 (putative translation factor)